jgi:hypothetical protein
VARKGITVSGPARTSYWTAADGLSTSDRAGLDDLADKWASVYDIGHAAGEFFAFRLIGGPLLAAGTLAGLDSLIRADWARRRHAAGFAR